MFSPAHTRSLSLSHSSSLSLIVSLPHNCLCIIFRYLSHSFSFPQSLIRSLTCCLSLNHYRSHLMSLSFSPVLSFTHSLSLSLILPSPLLSLLLSHTNCLAHSSLLSLVVSLIYSLSYFYLLSHTHSLSCSPPQAASHSLSYSLSLVLFSSHLTRSLSSHTRCLSLADGLSHTLSSVQTNAGLSSPSSNATGWQRRPRRGNGYHQTHGCHRHLSAVCYLACTSSRPPVRLHCITHCSHDLDMQCTLA